MQCSWQWFGHQFCFSDRVWNPECLNMLRCNLVPCLPSYSYTLLCISSRYSMVSTSVHIYLTIQMLSQNSSIHYQLSGVPSKLIYHINTVRNECNWKCNSGWEFLHGDGFKFGNQFELIWRMYCDMTILKNIHIPAENRRDEKRNLTNSNKFCAYFLTENFTVFIIASIYWKCVSHRFFSHSFAFTVPNWFRLVWWCSILCVGQLKWFSVSWRVYT